MELVDDHSWQSAGGETADVASAVAKWSAAAQQRDDILMFEICESGRPVGQVFLHDMNPEQAQSLIGYHLFVQNDRGRGIGTHALRLLVEYVREFTSLRELVIITSGDNVASRRIAEKNGFTFVGPPREDPEGVCLKLTLK